MIAFLGKQQIHDWKVTSTGGPLTQSAGRGVKMANFAQTVWLLSFVPFQVSYDQLPLQSGLAAWKGLYQLLCPVNVVFHSSSPFFPFTNRSASSTFTILIKRRCPSPVLSWWGWGKVGWRPMWGLIREPLSLLLTESVIGWASLRVKTICSFSKELTFKVQNSGQRHLRKKVISHEEWKVNCPLT